MNSVTCQASSERHRSLTPREVRAAAFSGRPLRRWGTHATAATRAGRAHRARAPRQPTPASWATGALRPAASAALMPSAVEYTLVMRPMRSGNSRLTMPGKSTLPTAIAAPRSAVPRKSAASAPAERTRIPAASASRLASSARSTPNTRASRGAIGESTPNVRSGSVVSRPATPLDTLVSARISPIRGATEVSAGRRFAARSTSPETSNTHRKPEGPRWSARSAVSVAGTFFVMQTGYTAARVRALPTLPKGDDRVGDDRPRLALLPLYAVNRLLLPHGRVWRGQVDTGRELEPEVCFAVDE